MSKIEAFAAIDDRFLDLPYALAGRAIDPLAGTLTWQGRTTHLRRKELEVLALLASAAGAVVSRHAFVAAVWDGNDLVGDRGVSDTIFSLRRALRDDDPKLPLIRTVPRRGYQLSAAVQPVVTQLPAFVPGGDVLHSAGWRLLQRLGDSALSETWVAEPSGYNTDVESTARRVFRFCRSEAYLRRLQREVTLLRYVNQSLSEHPGFAVIRDWQLDEPPYFLARDHARFGSLRQWTEACGMPRTLPLRSMVDLSEALAALHQLGVVHRNLSAARILVDETDAGPQFKISALGLGALADRSKLAPLQITALGLTMGAEEAGTQAIADDDVAALALVFLQISVGDWQAEATEDWLSRVADGDLQALLRRCVGGAGARPSASELARRLHSLLAPSATTDAGESPVSPETGPASLLAVAPLTSAGTFAGPEFIGRYRLLDRLGEGGMGVVYLAEQRDPYRKVALKIIRSGMDGKQILSRFEAERQALAMMNHPNVASVLDSGLAADGRPFFAMEYIAGDDIKSHCDRHHLAIGARIQLFLQVCDGVLHAHQKGVLHRDIKPSNLMVTAASDNAGTVKVIDFGLAKSLHGKLAAQTLHTSFGAFVGTPVYSSPEHVSGSAAGVDTRSDIYSMGVVLYELLVGMTPIASESLENLEPERVREIVCRSKLPTMREQLQNTSADRRAELAAHRAIKVDELPRTLDGDLSWVVGKCLERDPNDRYASVLALKDDLKRWLDLRPVEARPISNWYRFRKLVQRNRASALVIACAAAALLMTTTAAIVGYLRAERALEASRLAEAEATKAADFQVQQMQSVDPAAMGLSLRERLMTAVRKRGAERGWEPAALQEAEQQLGHLIDGVNFTDLSLEQLDAHQFQPTLSSISNDFKDQPILQTRLWQSLADSLVKLGRIEAATEPQRLALAQRQRLLGDDHPLTLVSLRSRGALLLKKAQYKEAEVDFRAAIAGMQRVLGSHDAQTLESQLMMARLLSQQDRFEDALKFARPVLEGTRQALPADHSLSLQAQLMVGSLLTKMGSNAEAEGYFLDALERSRRVYGSQHTQTLSAMTGLASLYSRTGRYREAEPILLQALATKRAKMGENHESTLSTRMNLNSNLIGQGRWAESEQVSRPLLQTLQRVLGPEHPNTMNLTFGLANALRETGKLDESIALHRHLLTIARREGSYRARLQPYMVSLADTLRANGEHDEALALLREVLEERRGTLGDLHPSTLSALSDLGVVLEYKGDLDGAESVLREALSGQRKTPGGVNLDTLDTMDRLARVLRARGELDEAMALGQEASESPTDELTRGYICVYQIHHSRTLMELDRFDDAESLLNRARAGLAMDSFSARDSVETLAEAYIELYSRRHQTQPGLGFDAKAATWRKRLKAMKDDPASPGAEILSGEHEAD